MCAVKWNIQAIKLDCNVLFSWYVLEYSIHSDVVAEFGEGAPSMF